MVRYSRVVYNCVLKGVEFTDDVKSVKTTTLTDGDGEIRNALIKIARQLGIILSMSCVSFYYAYLLDSVLTHWESFRSANVRSCIKRKWTNRHGWNIRNALTLKVPKSE